MNAVDDRRQVTITLPSPLAWLRRRRRTTPLAALLVLLVLLAGAAGWTTWRARALGAADAARVDALAAAQQRVPVLLSYRKAALDTDLATAAEQATGDFGDDYAQVLDQVVRPRATDSGISNLATVQAAGVVSATDDEVVVLVLLRQSTRTDGVATPQVSNSRVEVTMVPVDGEWLVAGLKPV